ncbi:MAG: MerR family transcriptional regulator, partial [Actinobacteria bacterium]|nr:MerR family transcriptional regulator [Actinomycetota bacterium]
MMQMKREPQRGLPERSFLSIGDVLDLIREEFPEITISKIRFLESQGLVNPERTPSGYRKFYEEDVERLKWVLRQQREHYLPLKVIRGKLQYETSAASVPRQRTSVSARTGAATVPDHYGAVADQGSILEDNTGPADHAVPAEVGGGRAAIHESPNGSADVPYPAGAQASGAQAATSAPSDRPERLSDTNTDTHVPPGRLQGPSTALDAPATTSQPAIQPTINLLSPQEEVSGKSAGDGRSDAVNNTSQPAGDRSLPPALLNELESFGLISGERI